jgi:SAM-dependent methyltransferase
LDPDGMTAEFNIKIASTERGKGYAREAMLLFLDYFFNHFEGRVLIDDVALDNCAGQQALLRFGFEHDPTPEEVVRLRMTREQYNDLYGLTKGRSHRGGRANTRPAAERHPYDASCAEIYDLFVHLPHDIPFFLNECQKTPGEVLELMAGTGRVSVPLLEAGVRLTCVDNSPEMLAVLREKLQRQGLSAPICLMDVCRLSLPLRKQFDLILIALNSFSLLLSSAEQAQALSGIHDHLTDTGRFICTLHNPTVRLQKNVDGNLHLLFEHPLKESEGRLFVRGLFNYEPLSKRMKGFEFIEIYDPSGVMISKRLLEIEYILHPQAEFEKMVQTSGFRIAAIYGGYDYSEFDPRTSPNMIYVLEKRNQ